MTELAGQSLGGYVLEEELGRGSMGMVYRGTQVALGREVAVKIFSHHLAHDPSFPARFLREAQIMARLNHPNIVQIYDAGKLGEVLYFVMEWIQGPTIGSFLRLDGTLPQHLAIAYELILTRRYRLDGGITQTLETIGTYLQVSRERVRQVEERALDKLRDPAMVARLQDML
jgi:serine/threonine protein kinase